MRAKNILHLITLCTLLLALVPFAGQAQNSYATWIGPTSGGEWNTVADWDLGVPADGTNAFINAGYSVNYNLPMATATFGILTNNGILNINTNGFNCVSIIMVTNVGGGRVYLNPGAAVTVNGNMLLGTNASAAMTAGSSLTVNGALDIDYGTSSHASGTDYFTNSGGILMADSTAVNNNSGTGVGLFVISGGTNNLGTTVVGRQGGASFSTLGTEGLIIYNGLVTMTNLNAGNAGQGNSSLTVEIAGGVVTNVGNIYINQGTSGRGSRVLQTGGFFAIPDPGIVNPNPTVAGSLNIFAVTGGTNVAGGLSFGSGTGAGTVNFTNSAVMYIGSQGISSNGAVLLNATLMSGGLFGATAPWTGSSTMRLNSGTFTFRTADMTGLPNNITLNNPLIGNGGLNVTGTGTLTLAASNTYIGGTYISSGTLSLGSSGSLAQAVYVGSGATYDVSELASAYAVNSGQTLGGYGTVTGAVTVASGGIIFAGSNNVPGTLTLQNALVETNGATIQFQLSGSPGGPNNGLISAPGGLNASGSNTLYITGSPLVGDAYPLIYYGSGGFTGNLNNFILGGGGTGIFSNSASAETIYFVPQAVVRGPTNIVWLGNSTANNWDIENATNWLNVGTGSLDYFVPGDSALFSNQGGIHPLVNITTTVYPGSVTINTTSNYTFAGSGYIAGTGPLTVSNGVLTVLTANTYTGPTILDGGVLSTTNIGASSFASGIGAATTDPGNLIFNGGTLNLYGNSAVTDHGMTLTNGGGIIDVSNGVSLTLDGNIVGPGTLTAVDSGTLILNNANSYTNSTIVAGSTLQLNNASGAGTGTISLSNSVLRFYPSGGITVANPLNFVGATNTIINTSGSGGNPISSGNWTGSGVILLSNTYDPFTLNGNLDGFTGTVQYVAPAAADLRFNSGGGNTCFGSTNATFDLGDTGVLEDRNPGTMNLGALKGGSGAILEGQLDAGTAPNTTVWTIGWNNQSTIFAGAIENTANGNVALTKVGTGTLDLYGGLITNLDTSNPLFPTTNVAYIDLMSYTGDTTISNGTLVLQGADALTNSPLITLASPSAVLDASSLGYNSNQLDSDGVTVTNEVLVTNSTVETLSGQTLAGVGTLNGILLEDSGASFDPGLPTGAFNVTSNANLSGTIAMNLNGNTSSKLISPSITINSATLVVTNAGLGLTNGVTFTLFSQPVSGFASVTLPATDPTGTTNYYWANNLAVNGSITLTNGGLVAVTPPPTISFGHSGNTLSLSWPSSGFTLQIQTNASNVGLSTNWVNVPGSTSITSTNITINPATPDTFFRLVQ